MNVVPTTCAASDRPDWSLELHHRATRNVLKLQARIVNAMQESWWNKVKALQHL